MTSLEYDTLQELLASFKNHVSKWQQILPDLAHNQKLTAKLCGEADYNIETPIVYNKALDEIKQSSNIKWITVADNPGKKEQEALQQKYLVGRSGLMAESFFKKELDTNFRTEVIVINKTPIHTIRTIQIKQLIKLYPDVTPVLIESQIFMANLLYKLQSILNTNVWIMGISELGSRGIFSAWLNTLQDVYKNTELSSKLYFFKHFSMGSFATDIKKRRLIDEAMPAAIKRIGAENRSRFI